MSTNAAERTQKYVQLQTVCEPQMWAYIKGGKLKNNINIHSVLCFYKYLPLVQLRFESFTPIIITGVIVAFNYLLNWILYTEWVDFHA